MSQRIVGAKCLLASRDESKDVEGIQIRRLRMVEKMLATNMKINYDTDDGPLQ